MKLSIIYRNTGAGKSTVENIISQLDGDSELIISAQNPSGFKEYKAENVKTVRQSKDLFDLKNAVRAAQGDYTAFVFDGDRVSGDYVKTILKMIESKADYYPVKWRYETWHNYIFTGSAPLIYLFADVYKKDVLKELKENKSIEKNKELKAGAPADNVIYIHRG